MSTEPDTRTAHSLPPQSPDSESSMSGMIFGLLIIIIVTLAGLWVLERGKTHRARRELVQVRERFEQQNSQVREVLGLNPAAPLNRNTLPRREVQYQGQPREVLLLGAIEAHRLGLEPGDVVEVVEPSRSSDER
jgi:hypothetical protein